MRKSSRRSPETNRPCESVAVTLTLTRFTVAFSGGPCCAAGSCADRDLAKAMSDKRRIRESRVSRPPHNARAYLFDPTIEMHALRVFRGNTGGEVQMARENLRIQVLERFRQGARMRGLIGPGSRRVFFGFEIPASLGAAPIDFLKIQETQSIDGRGEFCPRSLPRLRRRHGCAA